MIGRRVMLMLVLVLLRAPVCAGAEPVAAGVRPASPRAKPAGAERFPIGHWGFPAEEDRFRLFLADGFTMVIAVPEQMAAVRAAGLEALLAVAPEAAEPWRDDPAVRAWFVLDEPARKAIPYADVAAKVAAFHALDGTRPAYVNLNELDDPREFIRVARPRLLSYDYYQWWAGREPFLDLLAKYRAAAAEAGIPLWVWVEAGSVPNGPLPPDNLAKIRASVFAALAHGARGIQWWGWRAENRDVATVNAELAAVGPVLLGLESAAVCRPGDATAPLPADHWIRRAAAGLVIGLFTAGDGPGGALVADVMLPAERGAAATVAEIVTAADVPLERFDAATGRWVAAEPARRIDAGAVHGPPAGTTWLLLRPATAGRSAAGGR